MSLAAVPAMAATHTATKKSTTTTLQLSPPGEIAYGKDGKLTVTVTPNAASGTATVYYKLLPNGAAKTYGTISVTKGVGVGYRKAAEVGTFDMWVVYEGSSLYGSSVSKAVKVVVTK
jgi:hypothetical protein